MTLLKAMNNKSKYRYLCTILALIFGAGGFAMMSISIGGSNWIQVKLFQASSEGLWSKCVPSGCVRLDEITTVEDWLQVTRSFCGMAISCNVIGVLMIFLTNYCERLKKLKQIAAYPLICSSLFQLIGITVFTLGKKFDDRYITYGWSFHIGWISIIVALIGALILFFSQPSLCENRTYPIFERMEENESDISSER